MSQIEVQWLSAASPLGISSAAFEELRVVGRAVVLRDEYGDESVLVDHEELFGAGPARALALRDPLRPSAVLMIGEEGSVLIEVDLDTATWRPAAELPRFPNDVGGMCRLEVFTQAEVTLLHWELGILGIGRSLDLLWRHDLEWNHSLVVVSGNEVWFDLMYETDEIPQRIGEAPWGFSVADGRELFGLSPPAP